MPNQRSKDKVYLGGYLDRKLHQKLLRLADKAGMEHNRFGYVMGLVSEALKAKEKRKRTSRKK